MSTEVGATSKEEQALEAMRGKDSRLIDDPKDIETLCNAIQWNLNDLDQFDPEPDQEREKRIDTLQGKILNKKMLNQEDLELLDEVLTDYCSSATFEDLSEKQKFIIWFHMGLIRGK